MAQENIASITEEMFEMHLTEQNQQIIKWRDLDIGVIYEIAYFEFIDTMNGKACVILNDSSRVFAPSTLTERFENAAEDNKLPAFVRPKGMMKSKKSGNEYFAYDFVWTTKQC